MKSLQQKGVITKKFSLNDSSYDAYFSETNPSAVIFDRFVTEEQMGNCPFFNVLGWKLKELHPNAAFLIDTQDLHFLRLQREELIKKNEFDVQRIADVIPSLSFPTTIRELASIHRSDHSFLVSDHEVQLITSQFQVSKDKISLAPFFIDSKTLTSPLLFEERDNFVALGNFRHHPNVDLIKVCLRKS